MLVAFILAPMALLAQNEPASPSARDEGAPRGRAVRHEHPNLTVQQKAHKMTDQMDRLLTLTDKQYQKIYKLNLKELKEMEADSLFMGRHRGFGPGMGPGPGFGPGGPGNRAQFERDMARLGSESNPLTEQQMEELRAAHEKSRLKKDKQLRKILTQEQYGKWVKAEQERLVRMREMQKHRMDGRRGHRGHRPDSTGSKAQTPES